MMSQVACALRVATHAVLGQHVLAGANAGLEVLSCGYVQGLGRSHLLLQDITTWPIPHSQLPSFAAYTMQLLGCAAG